MTQDFRRWDIPSDYVDLIITDPPYAKKFSYLWDALGEFSSRVLKPGGSLITLVGHYQLPLAISSLSKHLKYRWILNLDQKQSSHPRMAMGIEVTWKPILWYVKGAYPQGRGFVADGLVSPEKDKSLHKWQQNEAYYEFFLSKPQFVPSGGIVCDPMAGSFTIGRVAERLGIFWMACDIEHSWEEVDKLN